MIINKRGCITVRNKYCTNLNRMMLPYLLCITIRDIFNDSKTTFTNSQKIITILFFNRKVVGI